MVPELRVTFETVPEPRDVTFETVPEPRVTFETVLEPRATFETVPERRATMRVRREMMVLREENAYLKKLVSGSRVSPPSSVISPHLCHPPSSLLDRHRPSSRSPSFIVSEQIVSSRLCLPSLYIRSDAESRLPYFTAIYCIFD